MECKICRKECDGSNIVRHTAIVQELIVCNDCLNDFGSQDYEKLTQKLQVSE